MIKKYRVVFFPIESTSRELNSRRHLAKCLLNKKKDLIIVVIEQQLLRLISFFLANAVFFGKHFFSKPKHSDRGYYDRIKSKGGVIVYLHEEGVFSGSIENWENGLYNTMNPGIFSDNDVLLVWSKWQKEFFSKNFDLKCKIRVSGHPRFDMYRTLSNEKKVYDILVNTSFSYANNNQGLKFIFDGKNPSYDLIKNRSRIFGNYFSQIKSQIWILENVFRFANTYPDKKIVIRPHPSESIEFYDSLFKSVKNIEVFLNETVEKALSKSRLLIQIGCTTSIEAYLAGIPCYTNKDLGMDRALIANELSQNLIINEALDFDSYIKIDKVPIETIEHHANLTLANLNDEFDSTGAVIEEILCASRKNKAINVLYLLFIFCVSILIYWIIYWPFKFIYYLLTNRLNEIKDFRQRYKPDNKFTKATRITKYIEIYNF